MSVTNSYPEKPIVPYHKTTVSMSEVIPYIASRPVPVEVKRMAYIMFRNESSNGSRGINNNYCGIQTDSGRWPAKFDAEIVGTVELKENGTGKVRRFAAFSDFKASIDFLIDRVQARGLYIGGTTHKIIKMKVTSVNHLAAAYQREWVKGNPNAVPTPQELQNFLSMYKQAKERFL